MQYSDFFMDRDYTASVCAQHPFRPEPFITRSDILLFRASYLRWLQELALLPPVHLSHVTQLLLWSSANIPVLLAVSPETGASAINQICHNIIMQTPSPNNPALYAQASKYLNTRYATLSLRELAQLLNVNSSYLSRVISRDFHCSFLSLLHCKRILVSIDLLSASPPHPSLDEIAEQLGYPSAHYFCTVFQRYTDLTPPQLRRCSRILKLSDG